MRESGAIRPIDQVLTLAGGTRGRLVSSAPLRLDEVRVGAAYEAMRGDERRRVAELKRFRRVRLGEVVGLAFEDCDTIRATLEEYLRTERIDDPGSRRRRDRGFQCGGPCGR